MNTNQALIQETKEPTTSDLTILVIRSKFKHLLRIFVFSFLNLCDAKNSIFVLCIVFHLFHLTNVNSIYCDLNNFNLNTVDNGRSFPEPELHSC